MNLLVIGSVALDSVKTPFGEVVEELGGSAVYFSAAASFFTDVCLVAVVGDDFPSEHLASLQKRKINLEGLERVTGKTFRWKGEYGATLNEAKTLQTDLNVLASFRPKLPASYARVPYLFLANIDPAIQGNLVRQVEAPKQITLDTMNFWIDGNRDCLLEALRAVHTVIINESEARTLSGERNVIKAAKVIRAWGPTTLVIKRGEYGAMLFHNQQIFSVPAYPLESVMDPTGAGDSFAGGFMGYLAQQDHLNDKTLRRAMIYGSVMASFCVEAFGLHRVWKITPEQIKERYAALWDMIRHD